MRLVNGTRDLRVRLAVALATAVGLSLGGGTGVPRLASAQAKPEPRRAVPPRRPTKERQISAPARYSITSGGAFRGSLPKPTSYYEHRADEFVKFAESSSYLGYDRQRKCKGAAACANGKAAGWMRIMGIQDSYKVPAVGEAGNGVIVGRMANVGLYDDETTGVPKSGNFWNWYYFVIVQTSATSAEIQIGTVSYDQSNGQVLPNMKFVTAAAMYAACPNHPKLKYGIGDFKDCSHGLVRQTSMNAAARADSRDAFAWFSCADGCCTAQWPPLLLAGSSGSVARKGSQPGE
jgi:hypothetical protein